MARLPLDPEPWEYQLLGPARPGFTPARANEQLTGGFVWAPQPGYAQDRRAYQPRRPQARASISKLPDGGWQMLIYSRDGRIVNEDSIGPGYWDRLIEDAPRFVEAVRIVEQMGHKLEEWTWVVANVRS